MELLSLLPWATSRAPLLCLCSALFATATVAQNQQPATPQNAPTLRVTTRLVQVNVIVTDKHGRPITGLLKEDFSILDDKRPQQIQVFSEDANRPANQTTPDSPAESLPSLPDDTYSNRLAAKEDPSGVTVILLDALNTEFAEQALTRKQVLKFLARVRPDDRIALYWLGNHLYALQEFTSDVASLRAALLHTAARSSRDLSESDSSYLGLNNPNPSTRAGIPADQASQREAFRSAFDQRVANESAKNRVHLTVAALTAIAHHIGPLRGRKNLVWVSGSFPFSLGQEKFELNWANDTGMSFSKDVDQAAQALSDAGVAVYPVDARGLMGTGLTAAGDFSEAPPPEFSGDEHLPSRVAPGNLETMKVLAERTGGKAFYGSNDLTDAIRSAMDDARATYTLGFYPSSSTWDGRFHALNVKVRTPGAQARARAGYFALPDSAGAPAKSVQAIISQTAIGQLNATAIGLRVNVHQPDAAGGRDLQVSLHLDAHDVHMELVNGSWTGSLQTAFLQLDARGQVVDGLDEMLQLNFAQDVYQQALKNGIRNTKRIRIVPGASELCIVVRDAATGNLGSLSVPISRYASITPKAEEPR